MDMTILTITSLWPPFEAADITSGSGFYDVAVSVQQLTVAAVSVQQLTDVTITITG